MSKCPFPDGTVVWVKYHDYPWWPSLVGAKERVSSRKGEFWVKFFNDPDGGFVKAGQMRPFTSENIEKYMPRKGSDDYDKIVEAVRLAREHDRENPVSEDDDDDDEGDVSNDEDDREESEEEGEYKTGRDEGSIHAARKRQAERAAYSRSQLEDDLKKDEEGSDTSHPRSAAAWKKKLVEEQGRKQHDQDSSSDDYVETHRKRQRYAGERKPVTSSAEDEEDVDVDDIQIPKRKSLGKAKPDADEEMVDAEDVRIPKRKPPGRTRPTPENDLSSTTGPDRQAPSTPKRHEKKTEDTINGRGDLIPKKQRPRTTPGEEKDSDKPMNTARGGQPPSREVEKERKRSRVDDEDEKEQRAQKRADQASEAPASKTESPVPEGDASKHGGARPAGRPTKTNESKTAIDKGPLPKTEHQEMEKGNTAKRLREPVHSSGLEKHSLQGQAVVLEINIPPRGPEPVFRPLDDSDAMQQQIDEEEFSELSEILASRESKVENRISSMSGLREEVEKQAKELRARVKKFAQLVDELRKADEDVTKAWNDCSSALRELHRAKVTVPMLKSTKVGKLVKKISKDGGPLSGAARSLQKAWMELLQPPKKLGDGTTKPKQREHLPVPKTEKRTRESEEVDTREDDSPSSERKSKDAEKNANAPRDAPVREITPGKADTEANGSSRPEKDSDPNSSGGNVAGSDPPIPLKKKKSIPKITSKDRDYAKPSKVYRDDAPRASPNSKNVKEDPPRGSPQHRDKGLGQMTKKLSRTSELTKKPSKRDAFPKSQANSSRQGLQPARPQHSDAPMAKDSSSKITAVFTGIFAGSERGQDESLERLYVALDNETARKVASDLEKAIKGLALPQKEYMEKARVLRLNLKRNPHLRKAVAEAKISVSKLVTMDSAEMRTEEQRKEVRKIEDRNLHFSQKTLDVRTQSGLFTCSECRGDETTYHEMQTRGADEPMTAFITCLRCGHK
mmetsp:Transcript_27419/g.107289  ORF Transcript_27419/g.107289 Transcript_27419/m.107289 type:complete len:961 (-) Transcript_27419:1312-4194(-)